jgi:KaiC/GvpD/RAD55 family RecA-like ATPase
MQTDVIASENIAIETSLLKVMSNRYYFNTYIDSLSKDRLLPNTSVLLKDYEKYFQIYPEHERVDFGLFFTQFSQNWHSHDFDNSDIEYYRDYVFPAIERAENEEVEKCLLGLIQKQTLQELVDKSKSEFNLEKLRETLDNYESHRNQILKDCDTDCFTIENIDFSVLDKKKGIPYFSPTLQDGLGSLVKGQFIIVSADYGAGKTAFVISQAASSFKFLNEINSSRPILYFNSEGTEADVYTRFLSNIYKDKIEGGFESVLNNISKVKEHFVNSFNAALFMVFQIAGNSINYIKSKIEKYNPALVIIDICDVLAKEESPQLLKKLYDIIRQTAGSHCPIIGTTQSGNTEYQDKETGKIKTRKWLTDKALYGSKTGKGGAADTIITIGKDDNNPIIRYISTPKKKRGTPVQLTCEIEEKYSNYKELTW